MTDTPTRPVVLVTGASGGIGAATAVHLADAGADLVLTGRDADRLARVAAGLDGGSVLTIHGDLLDDRTPGAVVEAAVTRFGRLDVVINNAGTESPLQRIADLDRDAWRRTVEVNLLAPAALAAAALPHLRLVKGRVVNVALLQCL